MAPPLDLVWSGTFHTPDTRRFLCWITAVVLGCRWSAAVRES